MLDLTEQEIKKIIEDCKNNWNANGGHGPSNLINDFCQYLIDMIESDLNIKAEQIGKYYNQNDK